MEQRTYFAPAERATPDQIQTDYDSLRVTPLVRQLLDSFPQPSMILNRQRQVVYANDKLLALLHTSHDAVVGLRPGEMLNCIHAREMEAGCGTSKFCSQCGAVNAIWESIKSDTAQVRECRITCQTPEGFAALDLRVWGTPVAVGRPFTVFAVQDITDEKRRAVLERVFFNDVLDIATGLSGVLEPWPEASPSEVAEMGETASHLSDELLEEIRSYRDLMAAERGELQAHFTQIDAGRLIAGLCDVFGRHSLAEGKTLGPPAVTGPTLIRSDSILLSRVLGHLIKNALEASRPDETIRVAFENVDGRPAFSVHNPSYMPEKVQLQIFQRSFSTKGVDGRGIGTYTVKLLTERYLRGQVTFTSTPNSGTVFTVRLENRPSVESPPDGTVPC